MKVLPPPLQKIFLLVFLIQSTFHSEPAKPMKKPKTKFIYKIGLVFYLLLILGVFAFIGCKQVEISNEKKQIEKDAKEILNYPNLNK
jgi:hypothetical protein